MADLYPLGLVLSTGRSGTTYLQNLFREALPAEAEGILHESLHPGRAKPAVFHRRFDTSPLEDPEIAQHVREWDALLGSQPVIDFGWTTGCLAPALALTRPQQLRVLVLVAHPVSVAASFANRGHYTLNANPAWAISPSHANVRHPQYASRWTHMSPFEKGLFRWLETTAYGLEFVERFPDIPNLRLRSDEVFADPSRVLEIAALMGLSHAQFRFDVPRNESMREHVERRPLGAEWQRIFDMPEVVELASRLGFDMDERAVAEKARRYQLQGPMAKLRHALHYWPMRERMGRLRVRLGGGRGA
jgi:hypothetical protein